jgi:hypothetical protein
MITLLVSLLRQLCASPEVVVLKCGPLVVDKSLGESLSPWQTLPTCLFEQQTVGNDS